jgi:hypothetical protein
MKTVLTAATVATLTLTPNFQARADDAQGLAIPYSTGEREARYEREGRLRETHKQTQRLRRETRHERERRLRAAQTAELGSWQNEL